MIANGIAAIIIAYLLGSIPAAYIITRLRTGKDIRKLGGGNVGAGNVYREVGLGAAILVAIFDVGKGTAAVIIAIWGLDVTLFFALAAGLAAVVGHMWPVFLKFNGGNGLATAIGVLSVLLLRELLVVLALTLLFSVITRNPVLSLNFSLLLLPFLVWFLGNSWLGVAFTTILLTIMVLHFLPTAKAALAQTGSLDKLMAELLRHS